MDAISLLKEDHRTVAGLFAKFEAAGDEAYETKRSIVDRIIEELSVHAAIEELIFYPQTRNEVSGVRDMALESLEEHHIVKWLLSELEGMDPREERFDAKVTVLIENVRHHVDEEESDYFPKVRDQLNRGRLMDMGEQLAKAKGTVPTRPHPRLPDTPPGNIVAGAATGLVDKATDAVKGVVSDAVSRVTRSGGDVVDQVGDVVDQVEDKASDLKTAAERTAKKATATTKRTTRKATATTKRTARKATATTKRTARKATATTKRTARDATATTKRTAKKATKATTTARKKPAAKKASASKPAKRAGTRASSTSKRTAKRATSTAKRTAKKAPATAKKATTSTRRTAKKATARR